MDHVKIILIYFIPLFNTQQFCLLTAGMALNFGNILSNSIYALYVYHNGLFKLKCSVVLQPIKLSSLFRFVEQHQPSDRPHFHNLILAIMHHK
jgi:hypothetical protein